MRRKKQLQFSGATPVLNQLPTWRRKGQKRARQNLIETESEDPSIKKLKDTKREEELLGAFQQEMKRRLSKMIQDCVESKNSIEDLKNECLNKKKLDRGTVTNAEESIGARATELERLLKRRRKDKTPINRWIEFVESDFDGLVSDYQKNLKGKYKEVEVLSQKIEEISLAEEDEYGASSSRANAKTQTIDPVNSPEKSSSNPVERDVDETDDDITRSCSASLLPLIRSDLPDDIKDTFFQVLEEKIIAASDYVIDFGVQVHKMINILKTSTFVKNGDSIQIQQKRGPKLQDILPGNYQLEYNGDIFLPPPLDASCFTNEKLTRNFNTLFGKAHLQLIHSTYFGLLGLREGSRKTQPFHVAFTQVLPRNLNEAFTTDPYVMKTALAQYMTNFENMWSDTKRPIKVLNRILDLLLRIHLAPIREKKYKAFVAKKKEEIEQKKQHYINEEEPSAAENHISIINKSRNGKRNLFNNERKRRRKYVKKAEDDPINEQKWINKAIRCTERIETYARVLHNEHINALDIDPSSDTSDNELEVTDEPHPENNRRLIQEEELGFGGESSDLSRKRLVIFRSVLRRVIFKHHGKRITEAEIIDISNQPYTEEEIRVFCLISNFIMPYIPTKQKWYTPAYQIPFILVSNEVMRYTGYYKSCVAISPLTKPSRLHCLKIDAPTLFSSFCASNLEHPMDLYGFDGNVILSRQAATESKDAVFGSFFDIAEIKRLTASYGLEFQHNMWLLPGLKTVRLTGILTRTTKENMAVHLKTKDICSKTTKSLSNKEKQDKEASINASRKKIETLEVQLKEFYTNLNKHRQQFDIREMKNKWLTIEQCPDKDYRSNYNQTLYLQIDETKKIRQDLVHKIGMVKQALSTEKSLFFSLSQNVTDDQIQSPTPMEKKLLITKNSYKCIDKAENISIDKDFSQSNEVSFSGTDNGLRTMSETSGFSRERFEFTLDLYNRYSVLDQPIDSKEFEESNHLEIPKTFRILSKQIDHESGQKKMRRKLIRRKKKTQMGKDVIKMELELSKKDLSSAVTTSSISSWYDSQKLGRDLLRNFYYNYNQTKQKRTYELTKRKYLDNLCSSERKYVSTNNTLPIMFVGDRGYGIGSSVKNYLRFGGYWKPLKHSLYVPVCITNEHNTSQTCPFCFHKLSHPIKTWINKSGLRKNKSVNGSFICYNKQCVSVLARKNTNSRDSLSAFAIGLSGLAMVMFGVTFPAFTQNTSQFKTALFNQKAVAFLTRNAKGPTVDDV